MTVFISSSDYGFWDRAVICAHGDQTLNGAGAQDTLYVAVSSELRWVQAGDFVVVLDEFRFWLRYPKITESGGNLSWYKDYGYFQDSIGVADPADLALTWTQLGANDAARREASQPPVAIMGPHVVQFIDPDVGSVDIDFDWSDSYAMSPGAAMMNPWNAWGETDHVGGTWNDNVENPAAKTYSAISGLRGFRTVLEVLSDDVDPIIEFRRGVRYVFTLRRPEEVQDGDPADAVPITDFQVEDMVGSFDQGGWSASIRILGTQADQYSIIPGSLVIVFSEDTFGTEEVSIGPDYFTLVGRENTVMMGYIADGTVTQDSETGDVTFDVLSISGLMQNRENYPVPIEDDVLADEWYETPYLTVDRAAHHYLAWHTNLELIADFYITGDSRFIVAMDFLAQDCYSCIDQFIQDRLVARMTCDRFGRFKIDIDQQLETAGAAVTLFTLQNSDWIGEVSVEEVNERPISIMDAGGLVYNGGVVTPYMSHAPGDASGYIGTPEQRMSLALTNQADLNTVCGRLYAYVNNPWPRVEFTYAGNWRVFDIWPQEYVAMDLDTERVSFSASDLFLFREISYEYDAEAGVLFVTASHEFETDDEGVGGVTVPIPPELPDFPDPPWPPAPPPIWVPAAADCTGRRIVCGPGGVHATDNIGAAVPVWYAVNNGFIVANDRYAWDIKRDPWHWWTTGGTERTLWALTRTGIWRMENFPNGTWTQILTAAAMGAGAATIDSGRMDFSIEVEGRFAVAFTYGTVTNKCITVQSGVVQNTVGPFIAGGGPSTSTVKWGQHSAGQLLLYGINLFGATDGVLRRSANMGASWNIVDSTGPVNWTSPQVVWPYVDAANPDLYAYWTTRNGVVKESSDAGATWGATAWSGGTLLGTSLSQNQLYVQDTIPKYSSDGGASWTNLPAHGLGTALRAVLVEWGVSTPTCVLIGRQNAVQVRYWQQGDAVWSVKEGNLAAVGAFLGIYQIDRDTMGGA
jgi:hypothetical protein